MYFAQKLQNRRFCVVLKMLLLMFNTPKSEVLRIMCKISKIGGFAPTAKTPKSEVCVVLKMLLLIFNTPKSKILRIICKNSKIGGFAPTTKTPKLEVLHSFKNFINNIEYSRIGGSAYFAQKLQNRRFCAHCKTPNRRFSIVF